MAELIVQAGYMSGDMFGVASALKLRPSLRVLIVHDAKDKKSADSMLAFYESSVPVHGRDRLRTMGVSDSRAYYKGVHNKDNEGIRTAHRISAVRQFAFPPGEEVEFKPLGGSTEIVVQNFRRNESASRQQLRRQWDLAAFEGAELKNFLTQKKITKGSRYLFLWIRLSGKQGGAHTELDSSRFGWQQIIDALPANINPVLIGDSFNKPLVKKKAELIDLRKFWDQLPFSAYKDVTFHEAEHRRAQIALFDHLVVNGFKVVHLGMRSGVMESVALVGGVAYYMEQEDNPQQKRVADLAKSMSNFKRLELKKLPTRRGKVIDAGDKGFAKDVAPTIAKLAKHVDEDFKVVAARLNEVKEAVKLGADFDPFYDDFVARSQPVWAVGFPAVLNWPTYESDNPAWTKTFEDLLYDVWYAWWSKEGYDKGFTKDDLKTIVDTVASALR